MGDYQLALEKAGCIVYSFKEFGSYQGTYMAFVEFEGNKGIVEGYYGSCSGCDAFQAEFNYDGEPREYNGKYFLDDNTWDDEKQCSYEEFLEAKEKYDDRLKNFGLKEIGGTLSTKEYYERKLEKVTEDDWGDEREECEWAIKQFELFR